MDQNTLVDGGSDGLVAIADTLRGEGFPVRAIYLAERTGEDDHPDWSIKVVLSPFEPEMDGELLYAYVRLRRAKKLPFVEQSVRVIGVPADDDEASRLLGYARLFGDPPVLIRHFGGIQRALVAEYEPSEAAAA